MVRIWEYTIGAKRNVKTAAAVTNAAIDVILRFIHALTSSRVVCATYSSCYHFM